MWALAVFVDEILYICCKKRVFLSRKKCSVKYSDNRKYAARVIALCHDKNVLERLKSKLESHVTSILKSWDLDGLPQSSYNEVVQEIEDNQSASVMFIDEHLLNQRHTTRPLRSYLLSGEADFSTFDQKKPQYRRLTAGLLMSVETSNTPGTSADTRAKPKLMISLERYNPLILDNPKDEKSPTIIQNIMTTSNQSGEMRVPTYLNLTTPSNDETNSCNDVSVDSAMLNCVIDETPSDTTAEIELECPTTFASVGKPTFSSTIQESPEAEGKREQISKQLISDMSSIIVPSSIIEEDLFASVELDDKSEQVKMKPISKPKYTMDKEEKNKVEHEEAVVKIKSKCCDIIVKDDDSGYCKKKGKTPLSSTLKCDGSVVGEVLGGENTDQKSLMNEMENSEKIAMQVKKMIGQEETARSTELSKNTETSSNPRVTELQSQTGKFTFSSPPVKNLEESHRETSTHGIDSLDIESPLDETRGGNVHPCNKNHQEDQSTSIEDRPPRSPFTVNSEILTLNHRKPQGDVIIGIGSTLRGDVSDNDNARCNAEKCERSTISTTQSHNSSISDTKCETDIAKDRVQSKGSTEAVIDTQSQIQNGDTNGKLKSSSSQLELTFIVDSSGHNHIVNPFRDCDEAKGAGYLNSFDHETPENESSGADIDFRSNTHHDNHPTNAQLSPGSPFTLPVKEKMLNPNKLRPAKVVKGDIDNKKGPKRKILPRISGDELVDVILPKKIKKKHNVEQKSPHCQTSEDTISRYHTRKIRKKIIEFPCDSQASESDDSSSVIASGTFENMRTGSPHSPKKRRVVFEFNESDIDDDDEEYKPSDEDESDSDNQNENGDDWGSDDDELQEVIQVEKTFSESLNITTGNNSQNSAPDDGELRVDSTSSTTKKHFCLFCYKLQAKIARHLELCHSDKEEVQKFKALPSKTKERLDVIATLRKQGDHLYNTDRRFNSGSRIVCRRPPAGKAKNAMDYIACGNCKGQYTRTEIHHHWRKCTGKSGKNERILMVKGKKVLGRLHERATADVRKHIFPYLREDSVVRTIRYDELIILFANKQCDKYGTNPHLYQMIRARLRLLGRFLVEIKCLNQRIENTFDVFQPRNYDSMIDAVRKVAGFLPELKTFKHPAVASLLGTLIKYVGEIFRSECIKKELLEKQKQVEDFLKLLAEAYGTSVNRAVTETQSQHRRRKEVTLPSTEDVKKMYCHIVNERNKYKKELAAGFSFESWKKLGETTLLSLLIFNRRRPGELERLYIEDFHSYRGINEMSDKEIYSSLSAEGKALANRYVRFEIRGKRNRSVPVLVDEDVLGCLQAMIEHRGTAGVPGTNPHLFGLPSNNKDRHKFLRACNLMREYSQKCEAAIPHLLRGTQLRKHIATRCIHLNLEATQVKDLANFMGHHQDIHNQIYRQPVAATDIVKLSKILNIIQGVSSNGDSSDEEAGTSNTSKRLSTNPSISSDDSVVGQDFSHAPLAMERQSRSFEKSDVPTPKRQWDNESRTIVLRAFGERLENGGMPSGKEMKDLIDKNVCLKGRTVAQLRTWLHTQKKRMTM